MNDEVFEYLKPMLLQATPYSDVQITLETSLSKDLALDSLSTMEIIMEVEEHYDINIDQKVLASAKTVQDLVDIVVNLL